MKLPALNLSALKNLGGMAAPKAPSAAPKFSAQPPVTGNLLSPQVGGYPGAVGNKLNRCG